MALETFANDASTTVSSGGTTAPASGTSETWTVASSAAFPAAATGVTQFHVADVLAASEVVAVTNVSGTTWTVTRGAESTTPVAHAAGFTIRQVVTGGVLAGQLTTTQEPGYLIFLQGGTCYAKSGADGSLPYSGSDPAAVLQSCITALAGTGGTISFRSGTYTWGSVPALPAGIPERLTIRGEPGTRVNLASGAIRFLDFTHAPAAAAVFQNITVDGFHVDISAVTPSGHNHIILGTMVGNDFTSGTNVSFANITVRNIKGTGAATTTLTTSATEQRWVCLQSQDSAAGQANTGTNILIENLDLAGGSYGVECTSYPNTAFYTGDPGFTWDNVVIRNIRHDIGSDPDGAGQSYAHVQAGARGIVKTCWISAIWGRGSRDVGIEIDNVITGYVRDCWFRNAHGLAVDVTNYLAPANVHEQVVYVTGITRIRDNGTASSNASSCIGLASSQNRAGTYQAFGRLFCRDINCFADGSASSDLVTQGISGELAAVTMQPDEFSLESATYYAVNLAQTSVTATSSPKAFYANNDNGPSQRTKLTLRDVHVHMAGSNASASFPANVRAYSVNGWQDMTIDNVSWNIAFTTPGSFVQYGMAIGEITGATAQGVIRRARAVANNDTGGRGIVFYTADRLTIPNALTIEDCDFSGMSGGKEILQGGTGGSNLARVFAYQNRYMTFPQAAYTITAPVSGTGQQYTEFWPGALNLAATTSITAVQLSKDGATYYDMLPVGVTGTITKAAIGHIAQGEYFKVTYTGTLTVTVLPDN